MAVVLVLCGAPWLGWPLAHLPAAHWRLITGPPCSPVGSPEERKGLTGYQAILFERAAVHDPAGPPLTHPTASGDAAFRLCETLSTGIIGFSGLHYLRLTRSPTYASTAPLPRRLQGWLPVCWLGFDRTGFAPAG